MNLDGIQNNKPDKTKKEKEFLKAICYIFVGVMVALGIFYFSSLGQNIDEEETTDSEAIVAAPVASSSPNWPSHIPEIKKILGTRFNEVKVAESEPISIYKEADITGDGIKEALVSLGSGGAYTEYFALMQFKDGKPVLAKFKQKDGDTGNVMFLEGSSVSHGISVELAPTKNAIYAESWNVDAFNTDTIECQIEAYQWNSSMGIFEYNEQLGLSATNSYCEKITMPQGR